MTPRRAPRSPGLRARTARGGVVNAVFLSGAELLVLLQGLLATALLGPDALYGRPSVIGRATRAVWLTGTSSLRSTPPAVS